MNTRYRIEKKAAGEGGFGRIDRAFDTELERRVAIKTLDPLFSDSLSPEDIERFRREARVLATLSHPNIPAIYDIHFEPENAEFRIIFEWIDGPNLREHLQDRDTLDLQHVRAYFSGICSALTHAHSKGVVHRDIKPENVVLSTSADTCYLVDFGIALRQDDITRITHGEHAIGTPGYMSPEQERGLEVTSATDLFSLGVVLYESLAGSRPTVGEYKPLNVHNESIPPSVDDLIREALSDEPVRRPKSAAEFSERLSDALRPRASFASTLDRGSLFEIKIALSEMRPSDFVALPRGQRKLVVTRLTDLATVDDEFLRPAVASLLTELIRLAHTTDVDDYNQVVAYSFEYGYEKQFGENYYGNGQVRAALTDVAKICNSQVHTAISKMALSRSSEDALRDRAGWYFYDLRLLLQGLLLNPACDDALADEIDRALRLVLVSSRRS